MWDLIHIALATTTSKPFDQDLSIMCNNLA
jgi:hypothetical protein